MASQSSSQFMRYPLGLPAGSVRSLLLLMVLGLLCAVVLISTAAKPIPIPAYLVGLLFMSFIGFFSAHGRSINKHKGETGPLGLPGWLVRLFLAAVLIGTLAFKITQAWPDLLAQLQTTLEAYSQHPLQPFYALVFIIGGFLVGHVAQIVFGLDNQPVFYQDFIAWVSLLSMVGMVIAMLVTLVINPNLRSEAPIDLSLFEGVVAGVIAFYFSARS